MANPGTYVIVEGGLARVVDDTGQERDDVLVIDWDVIEDTADIQELRDIRENVDIMYHAKDRAAVLGQIDHYINMNSLSDAD